MDAKKKQQIILIAGFCGGGVFFVLNILTEGAVPGGYIGGILGALIFGGLAALILKLME